LVPYLRATDLHQNLLLQELFIYTTTSSKWLKTQTYRGLMRKSANQLIKMNVQTQSGSRRDVNNVREPHSTATDRCPQRQRARFITGYNKAHPYTQDARETQYARQHVNTISTCDTRHHSINFCTFSKPVLVVFRSLPSGCLGSSEIHTSRPAAIHFIAVPMSSTFTIRRDPQTFFT